MIIDKEQVYKFRDKVGHQYGVIECKFALMESNGDEEIAKQILKNKYSSIRRMLK